MSLFTDEEEDFDEERDDSGAITEENGYLRDCEKGLELVRSILERNHKKLIPPKTDYLIHNGIFPLLAELHLEHEQEIYQELSRISRRMKQEKIRILDGKVVLGVGGRFSAGKSCFINSITHACLPENQRETTSIATYVLNAEQKRNIALTRGNNLVELSDEAVQALTHQFYETYRIGFSRLIQDLVVYAPEFQFENIALLDTPGYNKADVDKKKGATDAEAAKQQLVAVDYLIWLVDVENGELKADDEEFIDSLNVATQQTLIVFNKAGTVTPEKAQEIVENTAERLQDSGRQVYAVIAYDSWDGKTIVGNDALERFLMMVNTDPYKSTDLCNQLDRILGKINNDIAKQLDYVEQKIENAKMSLTEAVDLGKIDAVIHEYTSAMEEKVNLNEEQKNIATKFGALADIVRRMKS